MIELLLMKLLFATPGSTTCNIGPVFFDSGCFLSLPPNIWFPYFMLVVFVVIGIIAVIYMLSPFLGRNDINLWSKLKIYELLITVVLAVVFLAVSTFLYTVDPTSVLNNIGLLPSTCNPTVTTNMPSSANVNNLYSVALCDMYQYNVEVQTFSSGMFFFSFVAGVAPSANVNFAVLIGGLPVLPNGGAEAGSAGGLGFSALLNLLPVQAVLQYIVPLMSAFFAATILADMQQILLSACMIMFSIFMIIGLVARAFTVTRTFGGSMIAFALGIGFVYPLVTLITYGFLNVAIHNANTEIGANAGVTLYSAAMGIFGAFIDFLAPGSALAACPVTGATNPNLACVLTPFIISGGFVASGLLLLPVLNLVIVDAFIVDVSRVIGERMDLMSLLTRIV